MTQTFDFSNRGSKIVPDMYAVASGGNTFILCAQDIICLTGYVKKAFQESLNGKAQRALLDQLQAKIE
jgi:hypothetical protein